MNELSTVEKMRYPNRWKKGTTGNPRGRPRINPRLRRLARENIEGAITSLVELMESPKINDKVRLDASCALIELSENKNLRFKFMKRSEKTIWQYILLPPESAEPADPNDKQMQKMLAIRERYLLPLIETMVKQQSARDNNLPGVPGASIEGMLIAYATEPGLARGPLSEEQIKKLAPYEVAAYNKCRELKNPECSFKLAKDLIELIIGPPTQRTESVQVKV
jgi:hypothetical protein